jgi:xanthine dehydrogenase small subunit
MSSTISFILDNKITSIDFNVDKRYSPTTTVLNYLRSLPDHQGTKEGCAEGDCGACTVVMAEPDQKGKLSYRAVDSCLLLLPMIHGKQIISVENLISPQGKLHPVQQAMVETFGSQCGFCTPGIIMAMFALYKITNNPSRDEIDEALSGNLCRCTGYQPIIEATKRACIHEGFDHFSENEAEIINLLSQINHQSLAIQNSKQKYFRPITLKEALNLRKNNPQASIVNGATDLALRITKNHEHIPEIIDLSAASELRGIKKNDQSVTIGAGTALTDVKTYTRDKFPALFQMLSLFGSPQIRNLATFGGNIGTASPIGDSTPVLIAHNAQVVLESNDGKRKVAIDDFITGYRQTQCQPNELITAIEIPEINPDIKIHFYKFSKRRDLDISTVSGGFCLKLDDRLQVKTIKLAFGGMAEMIKRATKTENYLTGKAWDRETIENSFEVLSSEFEPISDARASAEGRMIAAKNLLLKFWHETSAL